MDLQKVKSAFSLYENIWLLIGSTTLVQVICLENSVYELANYIELRGFYSNFWPKERVYDGRTTSLSGSIEHYNNYIYLFIYFCYHNLNCLFKQPV